MVLVGGLGARGVVPPLLRLTLFVYIFYSLIQSFCLYKEERSLYVATIETQHVVPIVYNATSGAMLSIA